MNKHDFTIADLMKIALKRIWFIVAAMIVGAGIAFYYSNYMISPLYQSQTKYLVDTTNLSSEETVQSSNAQVELQRVTVLSRLVVSSYIEILDTRNFAEHIAEKIKDDERLTREYSAKVLDRLVSYNYESESETYTVTVLAPDPNDALIIAECLQAESGPYLDTKKSTASETLKIIDDARYEPNPTNKRTTMFIMLGILVGAVFCFAVCFIVEINDVRVRDEKELANILGYPVIGLIPEYTKSVDAGSRYYYTKK